MRQGQTTVAVTVAITLVIVGCGGGGSSKPAPLPPADNAKVTRAGSDAALYCIHKFEADSGLGGEGGDLGKLNSAVDTMIAEYKAHPDAIVVKYNKKRQAFRAWLRDTESDLSKDACATSQANRIEQAITGG